MHCPSASSCSLFITDNVKLIVLCGREIKMNSPDFLVIRRWDESRDAVKAGLTFACHRIVVDTLAGEDGARCLSSYQRKLSHFEISWWYIGVACTCWVLCRVVRLTNTHLPHSAVTQSLSMVAVTDTDGFLCSAVDSVSVARPSAGVGSGRLGAFHNTWIRTMRYLADGSKVC